MLGDARESTSEESSACNGQKRHFEVPQQQLAWRPNRLTNCRRFKFTLSARAPFCAAI